MMQVEAWEADLIHLDRIMISGGSKGDRHALCDEILRPLLSCDEPTHIVILTQDPELQAQWRQTPQVQCTNEDEWRTHWSRGRWLMIETSHEATFIAQLIQEVGEHLVLVLQEMKLSPDTMHHCNFEEMGVVLVQSDVNARFLADWIFLLPYGSYSLIRDQMIQHAIRYIHNVQQVAVYHVASETLLYTTFPAAPPVRLTLLDLLRGRE